MNALTPSAATVCEIPGIAMTKRSEHQSQRVDFSDEHTELVLEYNSYSKASKFTYSIHVSAGVALVDLCIKQDDQEAGWRCKQQSCWRRKNCKHFRGDVVLDQTRTMILALAACSESLPWDEMRRTETRPLSAEDRQRLQRELPKTSLLQEHVFEVTGQGLMELLQQVEKARAHEIALREQAAARARIKKLFEALPAGTVLIRDDGRALGTMTNVPGRNTRRSIDCKPVHGKTVTREDVRLQIRDSYRLATPERLRGIPAEAVSNHERMRLLAQAAALKEAFAEIA